MADALGLGPSGEIRGGSSPFSRTIEFSETPPPIAQPPALQTTNTPTVENAAGYQQCRFPHFPGTQPSAFWGGTASSPLHTMRWKSVSIATGD
jgi:hypothetical protein